MTYAMWGILTGMTLMFSFSFYRYRQSLLRMQEIRSPGGHPVMDKLRERLGL